MRYTYKYIDAEGKPLKTCPDCGHDLTADGGVTAVLSIGGRTVDVASALDAETGFLDDTADEAIAHGHHSSTLCGNCGELLCIMDGVTEQMHRQSS